MKLFNGTSLSTVRKSGQSRITYSLVKREDTYGLSVRSSDLSEGGVLIEDITRDRAEAEKLHRLLADNMVFPLNVFEILDDILGS